MNPIKRTNGSELETDTDLPSLAKDGIKKNNKSIYLFKDHKVNLLHIESRSSKRSIGDYEFIVEIDTLSGDVSGAIEGLRKQSSYFQIISRDHKDADGWSIRSLQKKKKPHPNNRVKLIFFSRLVFFIHFSD